MKHLLLLMIIGQFCNGQSTTTESFSEKRWIINSNLNVPAAKFHLAKISQPDGAKGFLEIFSSFGVGMSLNYGTAIFQRDVVNNKILQSKTEFYNIVGLQAGVLYSSKLANDFSSNVNDFAIYIGLNILDLQVGVGYELGTKRLDSNGWFVSLSYGIPFYKITGAGSFILPKRKKNLSKKQHFDFALY